MRDKPQRGHRHLRVVIVLVLCAFGLLPLAAMLAAGLLAQQRAFDARTRNALEAMVKNRKATIDLFLDQKMRQLELVAFAVPAADLARPGRLAAVRDEMQREAGGIVDLGLLSAAGRHLAYVGPYDLMGNDYSGQPWFQQVLVRGRYLSDVFLGFRRFPHVIIAVKQREAGRDFVLRATLDMDHLTAMVREGALESGTDVFVLNRAGEYQLVAGDPHRVMEKADAPPPPLHSGVRVAEVRRAGRRDLVATAWLRGETWVLVGRQAVPGLAGIAWGSPMLAVALAGLILVPACAYLIARRGLRQIRGVEEERAKLHESVAQSEKLAAIGRLAATTAHEINNPLAIIAAQVGVLQDTVRSTDFLAEYPELHERLAKIAAQVERGKTVTHRLLGFSRSVAPPVESVDVAGTLDETVSFVAKEAQESAITFVREYEADVPPVVSNRAQMQQVFLNVIDNAIDAIGRDGRIGLQVRCARGGVEVLATDSGPGIREADLERIFEPFYSTKGGESRHCGLGLAICRETMRSLGGRITAANNEGGGAAFIMWFPVQQVR
jgi:two-component system NtrC family sensor kinase